MGFPFGFFVIVAHRGGAVVPAAHVQLDVQLGKGEIKLTCADDLYVEDINGQEIDYAELKASNAIRVSVTKENMSGFFRVDRIILLPDDLDEYI